MLSFTAILVAMSMGVIALGAPPCTGLASVEVATGLNFPIFVAAPPGDTRRLFIVERDGRILIKENGDLDTHLFLDIHDLVATDFERGLLSIAFHPDYAGTGYFYVFYTDPDVVIARYEVSADPYVANAGSAVELVRVLHPAGNHNGGQLQFGPDGYLYASLGDNANGANAQDPATILGKMIRLDVDVGPPWIPADNPFVGPGDPLDAIWALGLRNPWRFSFDRLAGDMYIADVGAGSREEVSFQPAASDGGENYGWPCLEGTRVTSACSSPPSGAVPPIWEYTHAVGCSIIGGYVYRGSAIPWLQGAYVYSDLCPGFVKSFRYKDGLVFDHQDHSAEVVPPSSFSFVSFGEDALGELYICIGSRVLKIVPRCVCPEGEVAFQEPESGTVDARQPHSLKDSATALGLQSFVVTAPPGSDGECWSVCESPPGTPAENEVDSLTSNPDGTVTLTLHRPMAAGRVTTITYTDRNGTTTTGTFAAHPGNVNGDSQTTARDILALINHLTGAVPAPFGLYSADLDRSGAVNAQDITMLINLLNGAAAFDPWLNTAKPANLNCP